MHMNSCGQHNSTICFPNSYFSEKSNSQGVELWNLFGSTNIFCGFGSQRCECVHIFLITIVNVYKKFIKRKFELTPDAKNLNIYKDFCIFGREREFLHWKIVYLPESNNCQRSSTPRGSRGLRGCWGSNKTFA